LRDSSKIIKDQGVAAGSGKLLEAFSIMMFESIAIVLGAFLFAFWVLAIRGIWNTWRASRWHVDYFHRH
jgi:hypothetical protein